VSQNAETDKKVRKTSLQIPLPTQLAIWAGAFFALAIPTAVRWRPFETVDIALLRLVNKGLANEWLDAAMLFFTRLNNMPLTWLLLIFWLGYCAFKQNNERRKALLKWFLSVLAVATAIGCADLLSGRIAKPLVGRERPAKILRDVRQVNGGGKAKGFPSSHAANAFAAAQVLHELAPPKTLWWLLAAVIAFSRVYLGAHFPADVIGGAMIGLAVGSIILWFGNSFRRLHARTYAVDVILCRGRR